MNRYQEALIVDLDMIDLSRHAASLWPMVRPGIHLACSGGSDIALGASKIGGQPDLPPDIEWPRYGGRPQAFLAQVNLAEMPLADVAAGEAEGFDMPRDGLLSFFWDSMQEVYGLEATDRAAFHVMYTTPGAHLERRHADDSMLSQIALTESAWTPSVHWTLPQNGVRALLNDEEWIAYEHLLPAEANHQFLGHALPVQAEPSFMAATIAAGGSYLSYPDDLESLAAEWRNLLQVDSDMAANAMWGDGGSLYFTIRETALPTLDVDACWFEMQSG